MTNSEFLDKLGVPNFLDRPAASENKHSAACKQIVTRFLPLFLLAYMERSAHSISISAVSAGQTRVAPIETVARTYVPLTGRTVCPAKAERRPASERICYACF